MYCAVSRFVWEIYHEKGMRAFCPFLVGGVQEAGIQVLVSQGCGNKD
jgi:hypothetical protein